MRTFLLSLALSVLTSAATMLEVMAQDTSSGPPKAEPSEAKPEKQTLLNQNVEITLKNGNKFKGTITKEDDRNITLTLGPGMSMGIAKENIAQAKKLDAKIGLTFQEAKRPRLWNVWIGTDEASVLKAFPELVGKERDEGRAYVAPRRNYPEPGISNYECLCQGGRVIGIVLCAEEKTASRLKRELQKAYGDPAIVARGDGSVHKWAIANPAITGFLLADMSPGSGGFLLIWDTPKLRITCHSWRSGRPGILQTEHALIVYESKGM